MACEVRGPLLLLVICLGTYTTHAQLRTQWCDDEHDHYDNGSHALPHPEDFLRDIFLLYGENLTCTITHDGFHSMLHDLDIGGDLHPHLQDDDHDDHDETCHSEGDLLAIHQITEPGISEAQFIEMSPTLLQQVLDGCVDHHHDEVTEAPPTTAQVWGYGFAAVLIISAFSLLGVPLARWQHHPAYKYLLTLMLALAVGTLAGDAIMHLMPHGLGSHSGEDGHSHGEDGSIDVSVWKSFCTCLVILLFLNLQMMFTYFQKDDDTSENLQLNKVAPREITVENEKPVNGSGPVHDNDMELSTTSQTILIKKAPESLGWMIIIGDSFHNFADGLTLGAAFSDSWQLGLSTAVAVFCHELPHEFGDVAAMLSVGWSWKRVILMQILSQSWAFVGLCIGIPVAGESEQATQWILMVAAGMFLYVALCDIVPELLGYFKLYKPVYVLLITNLGLLIGFAIMLTISILEQLYGSH